MRESVYPAHPIHTPLWPDKIDPVTDRCISTPHETGQPNKHRSTLFLTNLYTAVIERLLAAVPIAVTNETFGHLAVAQSPAYYLGEVFDSTNRSPSAPRHPSNRWFPYPNFERHQYLPKRYCNTTIPVGTKASIDTSPPAAGFP